MITIKTYNIIDLFSGAGGLSLGFKQTGKINIVAAAENNPNARKTYKRNFAEVKRLYPDVRTIDYNELKEAVGQVDIVIGGPPCQGFSNANRQHSTIISMNNRLVKEYVRAICELQPTAFVMENVAMLKSQVHRFFLEENDMTNAKILNLPLREDNIEILPQNMNFEGSRELILSAPNGVQYAWAETFYKTINLLYRYRINQPKFDLSLTKYEKKLVPQLQELFRGFNGTESSNRIQQKDSFMAIQILNYIENKEKREESFDRVIQAIRDSLLIQRALLKVKELSDNNIHVFDYVEKDGGLYATVKSYSVLDYLQGILENEPYNYSTQKRTNNGRIVRCITFQCVHDVIGTFTDELCQFPRVFSFFIVCQPSNPPQPGQRISGKRTTSSLLSEKEVIFYCTNSTLLVDSPTVLNIRPEGSQTKSSPKPLIRSL